MAATNAFEFEVNQKSHHNLLLRLIRNRTHSQHAKPLKILRDTHTYIHTYTLCFFYPPPLSDEASPILVGKLPGVGKNFKFLETLHRHVSRARANRSLRPSPSQIVRTRQNTRLPPWSIYWARHNFVQILLQIKRVEPFSLCTNSRGCAGLPHAWSSPLFLGITVCERRF